MITEERRNVLDQIHFEREFQDQKFGVQDHSNDRWNCILSEEVGEAAKEVNEKNDLKLRAELVQVAASAAAWIECLDRRSAARQRVHHLVSCPGEDCGCFS